MPDVWPEQPEDKRQCNVQTNCVHSPFI